MWAVQEELKSVTKELWTLGADLEWPKKRKINKLVKRITYLVMCSHSRLKKSMIQQLENLNSPSAPGSIAVPLLPPPPRVDKGNSVVSPAHSKRSHHEKR